MEDRARVLGKERRGLVGDCSLGGKVWAVVNFVLLVGLIVVNLPGRGYGAPTSGYRFATQVVGETHSDPTRAIGPPDGKYTSLGRDGYIVITMKSLFYDGRGADIRIYEVGSLQGGEDEVFDVYISKAGAQWIKAATDVKNDPGTIFASVDISPNLGPYRYIKIVNRSPRGGGTPGADIDAIEVLHTKFSVVSLVIPALLVLTAIILMPLLLK